MPPTRYPGNRQSVEWVPIPHEGRRKRARPELEPGSSSRRASRGLSQSRVGAQPPWPRARGETLARESRREAPTQPIADHG